MPFKYMVKVFVICVSGNVYGRQTFRQHLSQVTNTWYTLKSKQLKNKCVYHLQRCFFFFFTDATLPYEFVDIQFVDINHL